MDIITCMLDCEYMCMYTPIFTMCICCTHRWYAVSGCMCFAFTGLVNLGILDDDSELLLHLIINFSIYKFRKLEFLYPDIRPVIGFVVVHLLKKVLSRIICKWGGPIHFYCLLCGSKDPCPGRTVIFFLASLTNCLEFQAYPSLPVFPQLIWYLGPVLSRFNCMAVLMSKCCCASPEPYLCGGNMYI